MYSHKKIEDITYSINFIQRFPVFFGCVNVPSRLNGAFQLARPHFQIWNIFIFDKPGKLNCILVINYESNIIITYNMKKLEVKLTGDKWLHFRSTERCKCDSKSNNEHNKQYISITAVNIFHIRISSFRVFFFRLQLQHV